MMHSRSKVREWKWMSDEFHSYKKKHSVNEDMQHTQTYAMLTHLVANKAESSESWLEIPKHDAIVTAG